MRIDKLATTSKQLGNNMLELKNGRINGYKITRYVGYAPAEVEYYGSIYNPVGKVISYDTAHDLIFGAPIAPIFSKVVN